MCFELGGCQALLCNLPGVYVREWYGRSFRRVPDDWFFLSALASERPGSPNLWP